MDDLKCNSLRCRKSLALEGSSHIFCIDCANALFSLPQICPACETALPDPDDVVQTSLNPHDSYKTSILAGLSPTIILDIAGRALNFYAYQTQQEAAFQALITKNAQERIAILEAQCNTITREAHAEVNLLKEKLARTEKDLEMQKRRNHDLQETHKANAKAYQKLRLQHNKAKQRALFDGTDQSGAVGPGTPAFQQQNFVSGLAGGGGGRATPRPGVGGSSASHGPFSSIARQQHQQQQNGADRSGRESASSWKSIPTGAGAGFSMTTHQDQNKHFSVGMGGIGAGGPKQNGTTGGASLNRPRHQLRQPGIPHQQQRLGSRSNCSAGSSANSGDSRTVSAAGMQTGGQGGAAIRSSSFGLGLGGVGGIGGQGWTNGGFTSGQSYPQQQHRPTGGGFRPAGTLAGGNGR
ncbi:hypothetical protein JCM10908_003895 [Rhodotorula pacifica]|uniref:uncharacterized protein n=1 Tax=Rhodotorula pacifica TaxID=1495444 RepID=UPI00316C5106